LSQGLDKESLELATRRSWGHFECSQLPCYREL